MKFGFDWPRVLDKKIFENGGQGWMDGWVDGWMDGWMNGWMDG